MKLPPELEPTDSGEVLLSTAEVEELGRRIHGLIVQRDHARAWAAFHQADAAWERERLVLLFKQHVKPGTPMPEPVGLEEPALSADLVPSAADGWNGYTALIEPLRTTSREAPE